MKLTRGYMRKAWRERLRNIDRQVNDWQNCKDNVKHLRNRAIELLLWERRLMVAKRRQFRFE